MPFSQILFPLSIGSYSHHQSDLIKFSTFNRSIPILNRILFLSLIGTYFNLQSDFISILISRTTFPSYTELKSNFKTDISFPKPGFFFFQWFLVPSSTGPYSHLQLDLIFNWASFSS